MFSSNPITRRRQKKAAAFFVSSGVLAAVLVSQALVQPMADRQATGHIEPAQGISRASFGRIALSPDGTLQAELHNAGKVVVRDHQTLRPVSIVQAANILGVRFSPDGTALLVRRLQLPDQPVQEFMVLQDHLLVVDPRTGITKKEGRFFLTP